jgi:hypothetical protein
MDRLALAKGQMERRLRNQRSSSSLPALIELLLTRPSVSAGMIAKELRVSQRATSAPFGVELRTNASIVAVSRSSSVLRQFLSLIACHL